MGPSGRTAPTYLPKLERFPQASPIKSPRPSETGKPALPGLKEEDDEEQAGESHDKGALDEAGAFPECRGEVGLGATGEDTGEVLNAVWSAD